MKKSLIAIVAITIIGISVTSISAQSQMEIPKWVKTNALWWGQDKISDSDYLQGLQFLIENQMIRVSSDTMHLNGMIDQLEAENRDLKNKITILETENKRLSSNMNNAQIKQSTQNHSSHDCSGSAKCITERVTRIVDGDTIYTTNYKVRLSLTNTPERNEPGFSDATAFTAKMCPVGSTITVDQDDLQHYDKFGRLLGNVYCGDNNLNSALLYNGHANILSQYCFSSEFSKEFWAQKYGCGALQEPKPTQSPPKITQSNGCDPSYPDFCIPSPPPDLDCGDISQKRFTVLQPDPHRFDGDKDGIGCES